MAEVDADRSLWKIIVIGIAGTVLAAAFGAALNALRGGFTIDGATLAVIAAVAWLGFVFLQIFFFKSIAVSLVVFFVQALAITVPSYKSFSMHLAVGGAALLIFMVLAFLRGRSDIMNYLKIRFFKIGIRTLPLLVTGVAIFIALFAVGVLQTSETPFSEEIFESVLGSITPVVSRFVPEYNPNMSVRDLLRSFARRQLPEGLPDKAITEAASGLKKQIEKTTGVTIATNETVKDSLYKAALFKLESLKSGVRVLVLTGIGIVLFFGIKSLAFFLNWIIILLAFLLFRILLLTNFFYVGLEDRKKEIIVLK